VNADARPRIEIAVTRKPPVLHAELTIYDDAGALAWAQEMDERRSCLALVRSAVLAAWLMAKRVLVKDGWAIPKPAAPSEPTPPEPASSAPPPAPPIPAPTRVSTPSAVPPPRLVLRAGAGPLLNFGLVPGVGLGGFGFLTGRWQSFSGTVEVGATGSVTP